MKQNFDEPASEKFFLQDKARNPEQARSLHLARSCSQSQHGIWFILPAHGATHNNNFSYSIVSVRGTVSWVVVTCLFYWEYLCFYTLRGFSDCVGFIMNYRGLHEFINSPFSLSASFCEALLGGGGLYGPLSEFQCRCLNFIHSHWYAPWSQRLSFILSFFIYLGICDKKRWSKLCSTSCR